MNLSLIAGSLLTFNGTIWEDDPVSKKRRRRKKMHTKPKISHIVPLTKMN